MPQVKKPQSKKKTTSSQALWLTQRFSRSQLLIFGLLGALAGLYVIFSVLAGASASFSTAADNVVLEQTDAHSHVGLVDRLSSQSLQPFRLYGNGLAICATESDSAGAKPAQVSSTTLSRLQMTELVNKVSATGFRQLKDTYNTGPVKVAELKNTIILNLDSGSKEVAYFSYSGPKPAAYAQAEQVIKSFCATVTTPYQPAAVKLRVQKVNDTRGEAVKPAWIGGEALPTAAAASPATPEKRQYTGTEAKRVAQQFKGATKTGLFKANGAVYDAAVDYQLPPVKRPKVVKKSAPANVAYADGSKAVRYVIFCATDACYGDINALGGTAAHVGNWYSGQEGGKHTTIAPMSVVRGRYNAGYYTTCHAQGGCPDRLYAAFQNIYSEVYQSNIATEVTLGFSSGGRNSCGWGSIGDGFAVADPSSPGAGYTCSDSGYYDSIVAHEFGHNIGFQHTGDGTLMNGSGACGGNGLDYCSLNRDQANWAYANSPYFNNSAPPPPPPPPTGTGNNGDIIWGLQSSKCIDVPGNGVSPRQVTLYGCHRGPNQQFIFEPWSGNIKVYSNYPKCLDVSGGGTGNGTPVIIYDCHGGNNQKWVQYNDFTIRSASSGKCLDARYQGTSDGTPLIIWDCNGGNNQKWIGGPVSNAQPAVVNVASGKCLDLGGGSTQNGVRFIQWNCTGTANQHIWWPGNGTAIVYFSRCMDVAGAGTGDGTPVISWYCTGGANQKWQRYPDQTIRSAQSGKCLTPYYDKMVIWTCNGSPTQKWK